jgi:N-succinyldiaminopimelate aminotransferase
MAVLRQAIVQHQQRFYGLSYDLDTEVLVTAGATEALAGALLGLLDTGDEVVVFDPMFDSYAPCIALAGAIVKPVPLRPPAYTFDPEQLRAAVTPRTRLILLNTPHNPTGRVFTRDELQHVADVALEHDLTVVTDEVYEHLVFDGAQHMSLAAFPGMRERTLVISSGGKTFNTTGWKIGWMCGPASLVAAARTAKQFLTYVNGGPFQPAIAVGLGLSDEFFAGLGADLQAKRDRLVPGLVAAGFEVYPTSSTYFVTADIRPLRPDGDGMAFCRQLPHACGVVAIPAEVLYADRAAGRHIVRFAFCKRLEVIDDAVQRLASLR